MNDTARRSPRHGAVRRVTTSAALAALLLLGYAARARSPSDGPEAVVDRFVAAWNTHDAKEFTRIVADDADWVTATGMRVKGRDAVESVLAREHSTWAKTTALSVTLPSVRRLGRGEVVLFFDWTITGAVDRAGNLAGPFRGVSVFVVTRKGAGWQVVAGQATRSADGA